VQKKLNDHGLPAKTLGEGHSGSSTVSDCSSYLDTDYNDSCGSGFIDYSIRS
jgi:hypothetical protein